MAAFTGCIAALPTPFSGREIDLRAFCDHVEWLVADGVDAVAVGGATGELPTLSAVEFDLLVRSCNEACDRRVPVLAHLVSNCTERAVAAATAARRAGADGLILACPPYNKPTQEGLYRHMEAIGAALPLPILIHDDPDRTRVRLAPETIGRLARLPGLVGLIEGTGDPARVGIVVDRSDGRWIALCGTDSGAVAFGFAGGRGCLSPLAGVAPRACAELQRVCRDGDWPAARRLEARLRLLIDALDLEPEPATMKRALSLLRPGFPAEVRLPMVEVSAETADAIAAVLRAFDRELEVAAPEVIARAA